MLHDPFRTHTLGVERRTRASDGAGGWIETWESVGTIVGSLQPRSEGSGETERADQEVVHVRWGLYTDLDVDVRRDDRLTLDDQSWRVVAVVDWSAGLPTDHRRVDLVEDQAGN